MKIFLPILLILSISLAKDVPFKTGESLKYSAEFNLIPVGEAELYVSGIEQIQGNDAYHVSFSAQTKGLANQLFKIRDQIDIWLDSKELYTHRLKKNIREGSYRKSVDITFDYDEGVFYYNQIPSGPIAVTKSFCDAQFFSSDAAKEEIKKRGLENFKIRQVTLKKH